MVRCVLLKRLPEGIEFPADLQAKISFDASKQELNFEGFMSKTEFDRLLRLSNDLEYQRSLERLFRICTFSNNQPDPGRSNTARYLAGAAIAAGVLLTFLLLYMRY